MRTPTNVNEPEALLEAVPKPGSVISILDNVVLSTGVATLANRPLAPSIRIASPPVGIGPLEGDDGPAAGADVMGDGYAIRSVVVVSAEFAISAPDTRMPAPETPGSAV